MVKQQIGFFDTEVAKGVRSSTDWLMKNSIDYLLGFIWVGISVLFVLYFYNLHFVYKPKAVD